MVLTLLSLCACPFFRESSSILQTLFLHFLKLRAMELCNIRNPYRSPPQVYQLIPTRSFHRNISQLYDQQKPFDSPGHRI